VLYAAAAIVVIAAASTIPLSAYALNLLMQASTYAIAVLGLTIVLGYTGQINLAQAAFFGLGAYSVALGTTAFALTVLDRARHRGRGCGHSRRRAGPHLAAPRRATTSRW